MTFYNNRVSIAHVEEKEIYLIKGSKNKLILNYYSLNGDIIESELVDDSLGEFDIIIYDDDSIYLVYQDIEYYLKLLVLKRKEISIQKLSAESLPRLFEFNILKHDGKLSIFYLYSIDNSKQIFQIEHNILNDDKWKTFKVDEARVSQVLNPIKVIDCGKNILLAYYYENQICLKTFDKIEEIWKESIVLTDNKEKLYLDLLYDGMYIHLVYSELIDSNYMINYINYKYPALIKESSYIISRKSNPTNPTILVMDDLLWIIWNESSRIYSRYSRDKGKTWSGIKKWDEFIEDKIVRYKYMSNKNMNGRIIHNSFGTTYPEVRFIGFW